jgi:bifunctional non-homologous end joining protein LigD
MMAFQRKKPAAIGVKTPFPGLIDPALATSMDNVPKGERWIHEIKFDGCRAQLHIANENTTVFTRTGINWIRRFKKIADDAFLINAASAILDGEVVAPARPPGFTSSEPCYGSGIKGSGISAPTSPRGVRDGAEDRRRE